MQSFRILCQRSVSQWRCIYSCSTLYENTTTNSVLNKLTIPPPSSTYSVASPKIQKLVDEISQLNLIEVSELTTLLKKQLNLPDVPVGNFSASVAQVAHEVEEEVAPAKVKTQFTVKLTKYDEKQKVALIKEIKNLLEGMNLVQAKKFVESAPTVVKADITKDEAEKLKDALIKVGATIEVE
ncbi:putative ribosomal protein L7/L12 dimerisation domain [Trypoxylus dichotomus]